ncbi:MAG: PDC sensor domain-containing protein [Chloroflexi bacterium]|nr:PDC sensor domain-containing protein [Chloroflexota bacterium]
MKNTWSASIAAILTAVLIVMTAGCAGPVKNERQIKTATDNLQGIIQSKLLNLDNAVSSAAEKKAKSGLQGEETRGILNGLSKKYPYLLDCSTADPQGKMITVAPAEYRRYEGTETATTEASKEFLAGLSENKQPVLSDVFGAVEGVDAVVLVWPVVTEKGELLGVVSALFKPGSLMDETIAPQAKVVALKVNVMQLDGMVIYCSTGTETGKNVLTDPSYENYPELIAQAEKIAAQKTGTGGYMYPDAATGKPVKKTIYWTSVGLHSTEWRLVSIAELGN